MSAFGGRWSDRLHPVVVRDVRSALRGKVYLGTMAVACLAVLGIAMWSVQREHDGYEMSRWTLVITLQCLLPILLFVLPLQAFVSLRDEIVSGTADGLVLTDIRPLSIVFGVLQASLVQAVMFVAVFAPLLALSYLKLAADVWTLLQVVWLLLLTNVLVTSAAFAVLAVLKFQVLREQTTLVAMVVVGAATIASLRGLDVGLAYLEDVARSELFAYEVIRYSAFAGLLSVGACMLGATALTQFQENRIIARRLLGLVAAPVLTLMFGVGMAGVPAACFWTHLFWYHAVTEPPVFLRRERVLVPPDRREALRQRFLLPGAARGFEYTLVMALIILVTGLAVELSVFGRSTPAQWSQGFASIGYLILLAGLFCLARHRMFEPNRLGSESARFRLIPFAMLLCFPFLLIDALLRTMFAIQLTPWGGSGGFRGTPTSVVPSFLLLSFGLGIVLVQMMPRLAASRRELIGLVEGEDVRPSRRSKARNTSDDR